MPVSLVSLLTAAAALIAVVGLVLLAGRAAKVAGVARLRGGGQRLAARERLALDRTRSLQIVSCDGRDVLLLMGGQTDVVVGWLSAPELSQ